MIKKSIKYVDFNGEENAEVVYFNLTKAELTMLELRMKGGLSAYIKEAIESENNAVIVDVFEKLILEAYGVKSPDGKRFMKSPELRNEFQHSAAYSEIFMEIVTNPTDAENFMKGILNYRYVRSLYTG